MRKIYWRPQSTPVFAFVLIALFSLAGMLAVERYRIEDKKPQYQKKVQASRLALEAMELVKSERLRRGIPIDKEADPAASGLIGSFVTSVTTDAGNLEAKQTAINPNWAAVIVDLLQQANVKERDQVAVSFSGSFPALNIAVALKTLNLRPTIISS
jgi:poly-gamma-glutamate system protein